MKADKLLLKINMDNTANTPPIKTNVIETGSGATVENIKDLDHDLDHDSKSASYLRKEAQELLSSPENIEDLYSNNHFVPRRARNQMKPR